MKRDKPVSSHVHKKVAAGDEVEARLLGSEKDRVSISEDFDAPLPKDLLKRFER